MTLSIRAQQLMQQMGHKAVLLDERPNETTAALMGGTAADRVVIDADLVQELIADGKVQATRTVTYYELVDLEKLNLQKVMSEQRIAQLQAELDMHTQTVATLDAQIAATVAAQSEVKVGRSS